MRIRLSNTIYKTDLTRAEVVSELSNMDNCDLHRVRVEVRDESGKWTRLAILFIDNGVKLA